MAMPKQSAPSAVLVGVTHAINQPGVILERPDAARPSCARGGVPVPLTRAGKPKQGVRYCSTQCRTSDVRDRRARARADLLQALAELRAVGTQVEAALAVLGLNPDRR